MFERFTRRARRVVQNAQEEATFLGHDQIGTEHILLGLIREETSLAARALGALGISLQGARDEVERIGGHGSGKPATSLLLTRQAKRSLDSSVQEAQRMGHSYVGTGHLLLGLTNENGDISIRLLEQLGVDVPTVRHEIMRGLSEDAASEGGTGVELITSEMAVPRVSGAARTSAVAPYLVALVPIAREVTLKSGARLVLLTLELWSDWLDLRHAVLAHPRETSTARSPFPAALDWRLSDDVGTRYTPLGLVATTGGSVALGHQRFVPPPPERAAKLTVQANESTGEDHVFEISLRSRFHPPRHE